MDSLVVLALKGNASTGGTDFIALYVSNKTGKSIWNYVFMGNVCILVDLRTHVRMEICRLFDPVPVHFHKDDLHLPSPLRPRDLTDHDREGGGDHEKVRQPVPPRNFLCGSDRRLQPQKMYLLHTVISSYEINDIVH